MPPTPPSEATGYARRSLLAGAVCAVGAAGAVAGCSGGTEDRGSEESARTRRLRQSAARESTELLARYDGTVAAHPGLAKRLEPLRGDVARHADELAGAPATRRPGRKDPSGRRRGSGTRAAVPADEDGALAALADAERRTADARVRALAGAPPELARLLASVAASGAAHAYLLTARDT